MPTQTLWTMLGFYSMVLVLPLAMVFLWWNPRLWLSMLVLFAGVVTGFIEPRSEQVQLPILLLIVFGFFAGFVQPRHAWRWALLLAVWVPINEAIVQILGVRTATADVPNVVASLFAFGPAFAGTYLGVLIQRTSPNKDRQTPAY